MNMMKEESVHVFDPSLYTGATSDVVKTWMNMLEEDTLTPAHLQEFLLTNIPGLYALVSSGASVSRLEEAAPPSTLIGYLEEFIYNGEKERANELLEKTGKVTLPCGKGFKNGEPSYNCRECSADHTCVLCVECFQKSGHRFHRYRMATSTGGGYCDCGDKEAWKSYPYCETHQPPPEADNAASVPFPSDILKRSKIVFSTILHFSYEVINRFYCADLRVQRISADDCSQEKYLLLMYNDEIHTFDQVIDLLVKVVKCSRREGLELASKVNNEGRAIIADSDYETCSKMKSKIESMSTIGVTKFLEVHIVPFHVVAIQCFALYNLLEWLKTLLKTSYGFRSALIDVFEELDGSKVSFLDKILVQDPLLWKYARTQWNSLLCSGFLPDYESKKILSAHYLANYPKIMENYIKDEEDHTYSTAGLSVQLFTVPSIAKELICRYGALESIIDFIRRVSTNDRDDRRPRHPMTLPRLSERASYLLYDVRYLLCSPPSSTWTDELRSGFCRGMSSFLDFLGLIEGMDDFPRLLGAHIEFEPKWERAFNLQLKCFPVISQSLEWCKLDERASTELFKTAVEKHRFTWRHLVWNTWETIGTKFKVRCLRFDATKNGISIHLPLTRFWGALFFIRIAQTNLADLVVDLPILDLMEPVMRTRAMIAQFRAGMWRKNGQAMSSSVFFYHNTTFRAKTLDMDIKLLQIGASLIDSNDFMISLIYKFGLLKWSQLGDEATRDLPETDTNQLWALVDEFLYLIIVLTAERFQIGVGDVTLSDCIKHELIHELALKPKSHSELSKGFGPDPENEVHLEAALREIAIFKSSSETSGNGHYELKDSYHPNFNVFFYHYNKEISFKTEQVQKARYKTLSGFECCPPPILPPFLEPFSKVTNLLNSDIMIHIMQLVLESWLTETSHTLDGLHKILYLFGLALLEEESVKVFLFTEKAKESQIVKTMLNIYCSARLKDHRDLLKWVLQKYGTLTNDESIEAAMLDYDEKEKMEKQIQSDTKLRAQQARAKIMDNMKKMQAKFNENFQEPGDVQGGAALPETGRLMCILCQEEESIAMEGRAMVYIGLVQLSTVHMRDRQPFAPEDLSEIFLSSKMGPSAFMSSCGHVMHADCWEGWRMDAERRRAADRQPTHSHDPYKEFLCPLCQCISNIAIPILPPNLLEKLNPNESSVYNFTFIQWLEITLKLLRVKDISKRKLTPDTNLEHLSEWEATDFRNPPTLNASEDEASSLYEPFCEAGYNLPFDGYWMLNIGHLLHIKSFELEPEWFEVPTDKLNWVHYMGSEVHRVATHEKCQRNEPSHHQTVCWDCTMVWKTLAYTIHSLEISLRYEGKPLFSGISPREEACLTNLIRISYVISVHKKPRALRMGSNQWAITLLDMIIKHEGNTKCMLEWDCFGVLVALSIVTPNLIAGSSELMPSMESFLLRLMLISKMSQILLTLDLGKYRTGSPKMTGETACLQFLMSLLRHECIVFDTDAVWETFKKRARPFLRCCAIFFHFKCPERFANDSQFEDTFENLASYLKIPSSCKELIDENLTISLFVQWGEHPKVRNFCAGGTTTHEFDPYIMKIGTVRINSLVDLPQDYSELLNRVRDFSCPNSDISDSHNPTMCLICGKILCSLSYCCQTTLHKRKVGACTFHAYECGGGTGIFLRIRECQLILFAGVGRGCFHPPPYLDEHHESDQGLRRGNKLLLSEERYKRLELAWINHNLIELVTRAIERAGLGRWELF